MTNNNREAISYIVYLSAFFVFLWRFWDQNGIIISVLGAIIGAFIAGGIIRIATAVTFERDGASETSVFEKVATFFITVGILYLAATAGSGVDSPHY
jgi:hypothetical protein